MTQQEKPNSWQHLYENIFWFLEDKENPYEDFNVE